MTTPNEVHAELLDYAKQYQHNASQQLVLEPFKDSVLLLRAKYASYEIITEALTSHGVQVSVATVRKFCRRHHSEMRRVRAAYDSERRSTAKAAAASPPLPASSSSIPEVGKRGPRIARDEL